MVTTISIINDQSKKLNWGWDQRVFYIYTDGDIVELSHSHSKNGWNYWQEPKIKKRNILLRVIAKNKVNRSLTVQTGQLTYNK